MSSVIIISSDEEYVDQDCISTVVASDSDGDMDDFHFYDAADSPIFSRNDDVAGSSPSFKLGENLRWSPDSPTYSDSDEISLQFSAFDENFRLSPESPASSMCDDSMDTFSVCYDGDFEDSLDQSDDGSDNEEGEEDVQDEEYEDEEDANSAPSFSLHFINEQS